MNPTLSLPSSELVIAHDLRDVERPKGSRGEWKCVRPVKDIVGLCLHQTATRDFSPTHPGLSKVPAHAMVHRDGRVSLLHHPQRVVHHGHALNGGTIGIEIACRAAGTEGDGSTFWRSDREKEAGTPWTALVAEATDEQLEATRLLCRTYIDLIAELGGAIRGCWSHRQGHKSRTSDPGSRIWLNVAERLRLDLGLADYNDQALGSGTPNPHAWRAKT